MLPTGSWEVDPARSQASFAVRHLGIATQRGRFTRVRGTIRLDERALRVQGGVASDSVETGDEQRDELLRAPELFDAARHPQISFSSVSPRPQLDLPFEIDGELTIRGLSRPLRLTTTWELAGTDTAAGAGWLIRASATGELRRTDYGLRFPGAGGYGDALVGESVKIRIEVCALRSASGN